VPLLMNRRHFVFLSLLLFTAIVLMPSFAHAQLSDQPPPLSRDFLNDVRNLEGDSIDFCYYTNSLTADLDIAVATSIGEILLLDTNIIPIDGAISIPGLDFIPLSEEELFMYLSNECDAFMGFSLAPGAYPEWLTFSRSYVDTRFVAFGRDTSVDSLSDLQAGDIVGTVMLTEGDTLLGSLITSQNEASRWRRFPYPDTNLLVERLLDGTVEIGVAWEPSLEFILDSTGESVKSVSAGTLSLPRRAIGIALSSADSFYRNSLDFAIDELIANGDLAQILDDVQFPGEVPGN